MENEKLTENIVLNKKLESYKLDLHDYVAPQELTVTITLSEYRELLKENAVSKNKIDKLDSEKWKLKGQIDKLKEQVEYFESLMCKQDETETTDNKDISDNEM